MSTRDDDEAILLRDRTAARLRVLAAQKRTTARAVGDTQHERAMDLNGQACGIDLAIDVLYEEAEW